MNIFKRVLSAQQQTVTVFLTQNTYIVSTIICANLCSAEKHSVNFLAIPEASNGLHKPYTIVQTLKDEGERENSSEWESHQGVADYDEF